MTDLTGEQKVQRGLHAAQLMADPLIVEALATMEENVVASWRNSDPAHPEKRERSWFLLKALELFKGHLADLITTGRMVEEKVKQDV